MPPYAAKCALALARAASAAKTSPSARYNPFFDFRQEKIKLEGKFYKFT
jgi:hypothetical protein